MVLCKPVAPRKGALSDHRCYGEVRLIGIGFLRDAVVVLVYTEPEEETLRVVSLRKAMRHERERFEAYLRDRLG